MVVSRGVGKPDYRRSVRPEKMIKGDGQTIAFYYTVVTVPASSSTQFTLFTVPDKYLFNLNGGAMFCDKSCIQLIQQMFMGVIPTGAISFDMKYTIIYSDGGAPAFTAGQFTDLIITNNDTETRTFYISFWGTLESVNGS